MIYVYIVIIVIFEGIKLVWSVVVGSLRILGLIVVFIISDNKRVNDILLDNKIYFVNVN